jgi:cardiolipin synthase A/B
MKTVERLKAVSPGSSGLDQAPSYFSGNQVRLSANGNEALDTILRLISSAQENIRWQVMLFDADEIGLEIAAALAGAAGRGVKIQLSFNIAQTVNGTIADRLPAAEKQRRRQAMAQMLALLREAAVDVRENPAGKINPTPSASWQAVAAHQAIQAHFRLPWNHYDHRKLLLVDNHLALLGGMNVGRNYLYHHPPELNQDMLAEANNRRAAGLAEGWEKWLDAVFTIAGPAVAELVTEFNQRWEILGGIPLPGRALFPLAGGVPVQVLRQRPGLAQTAARFFELVDAARSEIYVASPFVSFVPALEALTRSARRGVRVVFVYPHARQEMPLSRAIFLESAGMLLSAGVELYFNDLRMAHTKLLVVDQEQVLLGSFNLNQRSFRHDIEITAAVTDRTLASEVIERVFMAYLQISRRVTALPRHGFQPFHWIVRPFS